MITLYESTETDFTTLGLATLNPAECYIEEHAGGMYELTLREPMNDERHKLLVTGRLISAPSPTRESPEISMPGSQSQTVTRQVWKVTSAVTTRLYIRNKPNGTKISYLTAGQEVYKLGEDTSTGSTWLKLATIKGGIEGYSLVSEGGVAYLQNTGRTVTITTGEDTSAGVVTLELSSQQLFRIYSVERSSDERMVTVHARHISYDLMGVVVKSSNLTVNENIHYIINTRFYDPSDGHYIASHTLTQFTITSYPNPRLKITLGGKNLMEVLLGDDGIVDQINGRIIRDNFNFYILSDEERDMGFEIRYSKNLLRANLTEDISKIATIVCPLGKFNDSPTWGSNQTSSNVGKYGRVARVIQYDIPDSITTEAAAKAWLSSEGAKEFTVNHIDEPTYKLDASFLHLELAPKYKDLANLYTMHMYDSIKVTDEEAGISKNIRMVGYIFDVLTQTYKEVTLGEVEEVQ